MLPATAAAPSANGRDDAPRWATFGAPCHERAAGLACDETSSEGAAPLGDAASVSGCDDDAAYAASRACGGCAGADVDLPLTPAFSIYE